ncbi:MAG: GMC family oxidoreductase [Gammaproteobacteria bacterium]|jgi:choline dehydrogenase-like flavoprotein|nr:GMC family oxidoreductase [Gammaproteobacteria bacterium]
MKRGLSELNGLDYEITIIGSGPAGISLALGLSKKGKKVLLLEAGEYGYTDRSQQVYNGKIIGPYPSITSTRLRFFGGTSNHWAGYCRPLDDIDFEKFPISKADIEPYLPEASNILEIKGKFNSDLPLNNEFKQIEFQFSPPVRFGQKYRKHIEDSSLIDFSLNANVLNIREGLNTGTAEYLEVADENSEIHKIAVNKLVIACGGIENNRLLLWSQHLNKRLFSGLKIGNNWMEHPHFTTGQIIANYPEIYKFLDTSSKYSFNKWLFLGPTKTMMKREGIGNAGIRLYIHQSSDNSSRIKQLIKDILCIAPSYGRKLAALANEGLICSVTVRMAWEQKPRDENRVELDFDSKDKYGVPRVKLVWKYYQDDKRTAKICMEKLGDFFLKKDIGRVGVLPYIDINDDEIPNEYNFFNGHHMGGTPMGESDSNGVVDSNLKVFNTDNVWVAGSSVFTEGGHANPTLSIVQFSLRLADHLS